MRRTMQSTGGRCVPSLVLLGGFALACSGSKAEAPEPEPPEEPMAPLYSGAVAEAYAALGEGAVTKLPELLDALDRAVDENPDDGWAAFYSGTMRLWKLGEDSAGLTVGEMAPFALPMIEHLKRARDLLPDDRRVPSFLGLAQVRVGMALESPALIDDGLADLDVGIAELPAYGYFLRVSALNGAATDSPYFENVASDMLAVTEHCGFEPDGAGGYEYLNGPLEGDQRVCNNDGIVPHVWEGLFVTFGDVAVKAGWDPIRVRALYETAKRSPTFAEWPFEADLRARIDQADERAALYADDDATNDPPVWTDDGHVCAGCHQDRR